MIRRWIGYGLALFLAAVFRVVYTDWLAGFFMAFLLLLPLAGLLVSLPAALSAKVSLSFDAREALRGTSDILTVQTKSVLGLPLGRVVVRVRVENRLTGKKIIHRGAFFLPAQGGGCRWAGRHDHCGLFQGEILSAWGVDALGLFWLPLRKGPPTWQLVLPNGWSEPPNLPPKSHAPVHPRPGGGPGEEYELRDYRPGDALHMIHWKLSAKRDSLIVRETLEETPQIPVLTFDHFGPVETLDETFELLRSAGNALLQEERPFDVAWAEAERGTIRRFPVRDEESFLTCLTAALGEPAPLTGKSILDVPTIPGEIHLKPGEEQKQS